jgi:hypothetical protein
MRHRDVEPLVGREHPVIGGRREMQDELRLLQAPGPRGDVEADELEVVRLVRDLLAGGSATQDVLLQRLEALLDLRRVGRLLRMEVGLDVIRAVRPVARHLRFHDLRHTAATQMLLRGVHPRVVADILGDSDPAITMSVYSHVVPAMHDQAARAMEGLFIHGRQPDAPEV